MLPTKEDLYIAIKARMEAAGLTVNSACKLETEYPHDDLPRITQSSWARFDAWYRMLANDPEHPKDWREPGYGHLFSMAHVVGCDWYLVMPQ